MFDALIIGGGVAGLSCALILGSAIEKPFAANKKTGIIIHQKASHLQSAVLYNALGVASGTSGKTILETGKKQLATNYPHVQQLTNEKVSAISKVNNMFVVSTNKNNYHSKIVVLALGYTNLLRINGLESYIAPHPRAQKQKERIWLINENHKVTTGLYVAGTLAGWRSQFAIAAGSGAQVATDILTLWNNGIHTKVHDKI